jgi:small conductance mechanosensitive channel
VEEAGDASARKQRVNPPIYSADLGRVTDHLADWATAALPSLVAAALLLLGGWWFAGWAERTIARLLDQQRRVDLTLRTVIASLARYTILVLTLVGVLSQLGIQTTSVLAALGAIGLAIGLALQGTLANIAAGFMLLWLRPFKVGDYIEAGGVAGTLQDIGLFACHIHTWDGIFQFVPNAELWNKRLINYSRLPTRLVDLQFGISYGDSIQTGRDVLERIATADARVHQDPAPQIFVAALGDSAVVLGLRVWTDTSEYWNVRRALTENGKIELEKAGLTIPFPQQDVHYHGSPATAQETARAPAERRS